MNRTKYIHAIPALLAIAAGAFALSASAAHQDNPPHSNTVNPETPPHHEMNAKSDMSDMSGMHEMAATVTAVDHKTGIVDVDSGNMKLKVHFPANTIADLKAGDKIKLHLAYSKP